MFVKGDVISCEETMKWWGALSCLLVTQGLAQGPGGSPVPQCHVRCLQVYSGHNKEFQQVRSIFPLKTCQPVNCRLYQVKCNI